ncbi:MAG: hypothetical protein VX667_06280 [Nitrospinota bacterium]|nr:hypothetical protein [Nitrospinota bacterium]
MKENIEKILEGNFNRPDPYYGGNQGFEYVYQIVARTCPKILEFLRTRFV